MNIRPATADAAASEEEQQSTFLSAAGKKSLCRSYSAIFPRHNSNSTNHLLLPSPTSSSSSTSLYSPITTTTHRDAEEDLSIVHKKLAPSTRFAFTDLLITILRLDFYNKSDANSINFCKKAVDILFKWGDLPVKTQNSLRLHIEPDHPFNEDIATLITCIKSDPVFEQHGFIPLFGSFLFTILVNGDYDSRYRVLFRHVCALLGIDWGVFEEFEATLGDCLLDEFKESIENQQTREKKTRVRKFKRYAIIGAATGLGGILIGVTGGLAAPLIVSSVTALTATTIFAGLTSTASAAIIGSLFGVAGAGLSGYRMQKRVGEIEEFVIERLTDDAEQKPALHCVLCVSGWIEDREANAFRHQWRHLWLSKEQYTLRWESKYLEELGKSIDYFVSFIVSYAVQRSLMETMLASLVSAIAWPLILLGSSSIIDNPWNICTRRATAVGEHLAEALLTRAHGRRPITLIGFSLGARALYHCLLEMSKRKPDALGIIEDVILLGAPVSASPAQWQCMCSVVGGRVINGYCTTDWLLRFLYRTMSVQFIIAGTGPVENKHERKIVNFNLSHIVKGHLDYAKKLTEVLKAVGIRVTPISLESRTNLQEFEPDEPQQHEQNDDMMENHREGVDGGDAKILRAAKVDGSSTTHHPEKQQGEPTTREEQEQQRDTTTKKLSSSSSASISTASTLDNDGAADEVIVDETPSTIVERLQGLTLVMEVNNKEAAVGFHVDNDSDGGNEEENDDSCGYDVFNNSTEDPLGVVTIENSNNKSGGDDGNNWEDAAADNANGNGDAVGASLRRTDSCASVQTFYSAIQEREEEVREN